MSAELSVKELESNIKQLVKDFITTNLETYGPEATYNQEICGYPAAYYCDKKIICDLVSLFEKCKKISFRLIPLLF